MKAMRIEGKRWLALVFLAALSVQPALAGVAEKMVFAVQNVRVDGTSNTSVRLVETGRAAPGGTDPQVMGRELTGPLANSVGVSSGTAPGTFSSEQQALDWVRSDIESHMVDGIRGSLLALRKLAEETGANQALFTYTREVNVRNAAGGVEKRRVGTTWTMTPSGDVKTDGYSISPSTVIALLYVRYSQAHVYRGLPEEWNLPDAGKVTWQLYQMDLSSSGSGFTPVGSPTTFDAGGAYDEPQSQWNAETYTFDPPPTDADGGVRRLAQWAQQKANALNAKLILMDYGRTVQPVWKEAADGTLTAEIAVNVRQREIKLTTCGAQEADYINRGTYGAMLNTPRDYYFVLQGEPQKIGHKDKTAQSGAHAYTQKIKYKVSPNQIANLKVLLAKMIINPFARTDKERVLYDYTNDTVNNLPKDHYVYIGGVTINYEGNTAYVFIGRVPGVGFVCADTKSGDFWLNGVKQSWIPVYAESFTDYGCSGLGVFEGDCSPTTRSVYTVGGSPTYRVCAQYQNLFGHESCLKYIDVAKPIVGYTNRMPRTVSISYIDNCWSDEYGTYCSLGSIGNVVAGPMHIFRKNHRFLFNLASLYLTEERYHGLKEIDPPGVIPGTIYGTRKILNTRTLNRASLVSWTGSGDYWISCTYRYIPFGKCTLGSVVRYNYRTSNILQ